MKQKEKKKETRERKPNWQEVYATVEDIKANQRMLACEAKPENRDTRDTCDTVF